MAEVLSPTFIEQQVFHFTTAFGKEASLTFADLDEVLMSNTQLAISEGARIGGGGVAFLVMWLVSKNRRTPIFILNQLSLLVFLIQSALYTSYLNGPSANMTALFTHYIRDNATQINITAAANVFLVVLIALIEASLAFQVRVIFRSHSNRWAARAVTGLCVLLGLATVVLYLVSCIQRTSLTFGSMLLNWSRMAPWIANVPIILFASSVNVMSMILVVKLVLAIRTRRVLGLKQFDNLHILFIMSSQTMLIPSALTIASYAHSETGTVFSNFSMLLVVLSLPLSAMWASSVHNASLPQSLTTIGYASTLPSPGQETCVSEWNPSKSFGCLPLSVPNPASAGTGEEWGVKPWDPTTLFRASGPYGLAGEEGFEGHTEHHRSGAPTTKSETTTRV